MQDQLRLISSRLIKWYNNNKRDLPWRETKDPYLIWISEIILQQTRVVQGYEYYLRFTETFPDVHSLAVADENEVLKLWQGLGYYSRARNLHAAAKAIVELHGGIFPSNYKDVLALKGIGEYTAAAITSFAYKMPYAVVDGNVYRVLSRIFGISTPIDTGAGKKEFSLIASELLDVNEPDSHNQAIMEFGALHCTPTSPRCSECPLSEFCVAYNSNSIDKYPAKQGKTKVKNRYFNYLNIRHDSDIYLSKRTNNDIWKNLYELPLIESESPLSFEELQSTPQFKEIFNKIDSISIKPIGKTLKHVLSHRIIYATFYEIEIDSEISTSNTYIKIPLNKLVDYPISRLVDRYLEQSDEPDLFS